MDGIHDLGGMEGFGPVVPEEDEPVFHAEWERSVLCHVLAVSVAGYFEAGELRHAQERIPPAEYLRSSYYERWLRGLETLLVEKDIVTAAELACGASQRETGGWALPPAPAERIQFALTNRIPASLDIAVAPRFRIGEEVVVRDLHPSHHTRLPRYVRGRRGVIERDHGVFPLPDTAPEGEPHPPQHAYSVRFAARELWGEDAPATDTVNIDLFDDYLAPLASASARA